MEEYIIDAGTIEDLQVIQNIKELDAIFSKAQRTLVGGEKVLLVRQSATGKKEKFDELSTLEELAVYKKSVYKYLG